jgi:beta-1,4-mannosyltransferase
VSLLFSLSIRFLFTKCSATVLYDKAPPFFRPTSLDEKHDLFTRLAPQFAAPIGQPPIEPQGNAEDAPTSPFTQIAEKPTAKGKKKGAVEAEASVAFRTPRPALIVSSTSWTEDEDFGILLHALVELDAEASKSPPNTYPEFMVVVTGKGPQRAMYEAKMAAQEFTHVKVRTMWLAASDYPLLLGSADLGVCLHFSTSGLDLPMKVVDMFGAGLPVCAVGFPALKELVRNEVNGLEFSDSKQLASQLKRLFRGFPGDPSRTELGRLREGVAAFQAVRWQDNWDANAAQYFR